jgi:polysaccharide biosynthesis protein PslH
VRVLAISNDFPLPLDRGGPVRFLGLARTLAASHELHLLTRRRPDTTPALLTELEALLDAPVEVFEGDPGPRSGPLALAGRWIRAIALGVPPWIRAQFSRELARRAEALAPSFDAVVILDDYAAIYAGRLVRSAPVVCDKHNVMGSSAADTVALPGLRAGAHGRLSVHLSRRFERRCLRSTTAVVVTSDEEGERLQSLYGRTPDAVVPSAVELPVEPVEAAGDRAVAWLGAHAYEPNVEGLVRFVEEGWEPLGQDGLRLLVIGRDPPERVLALERYPGVELLGYVENLGELFPRVLAGVVPVWRGAGVKLKTLTFMAAGVPLAATTVAMEGVDAVDGKHALVADDPIGLASALRSLVDDEERARTMAADARALVAAHYTWDAVGPQFCRTVEQAASTRS